MFYFQQLREISLVDIMTEKNETNGIPPSRPIPILQRGIVSVSFLADTEEFKMKFMSTLFSFKKLNRQKKKKKKKRKRKEKKRNKHKCNKR